MITELQKEKIRAYLQNFQSSGNIYNVGHTESYLDFWKKRIAASEVLQATVENYLKGNISLKDFKEANEKLCREFPFWGFKNFSGQMQLNQYVNNINDSYKEDLLKKVLQVPTDLNNAREKINEMSEYLTSIKKSSENPKSIPRVNQSFLISYFWELQAMGKFPVYYGSSKKVLIDLGLLVDIYESYGDEYSAFSNAMAEIAEFLKDEGVDIGDKPFWFVEHILWNNYMSDDLEDQKTEKVHSPKRKKEDIQISRISWIPPIISDLEDLALNKETEWSKERNVKPEKAFETKLRYLFTIMGYETEELGQGKGREPDGMAISRDVEDGEYAIIYDAKARENHFSVGTCDREIFEYIRNKKSELRRRISRIYFLIVSSEFSSSPNDINLIREVYKKTQVPITMIKASDLLFIVENKLKNSDLCHAYIEDLLIDTGIKSREQIVDTLSNKVDL